MLASTSTTSNRSDLYRFPYPYPYPYALMSSPANQSQPAQTSQASTSTPQGAKNVNPYLSYALSTRINGHPSSTGPATSSPGASSSSTTPHGSSSKSTKANAAAAKSKRRSSTSILQSLTSDARTEHILLASRKVGRERAALLAGLVQQAEKEKEKLKYTKDQEVGRAAKESERLERERVERLKIGGGLYYRNNSNVPGEPSTPRRGGASGGASQKQQQAHHTPYHKPQRTPTFVYVTTPGHSNAAAASAGAQVSTQPQSPAQAQPTQSTSSLVPPGTPGDQLVRSTSPVQRTPRQQHSTLPPNNSNTHAGNNTSALPQTPQPVQQQGVMQTPLDSLLSAARSLMSDDEGDNSGQAGGRQGGAGEGDRDHLPVGGDGGGGGAAKGKGRAAGANGTSRRRGAAALEEPESPLPKRRRTNAGGASVTTGGVGGTTSTRRSSSTSTARQARVPSALDVLADQAQVAAAMSSHSGSQHSHHNTSNARAETMTTASATPVLNDEDLEEEVVSKRRVSSRRKGKGKAKGGVEEVEEVKLRVAGSASDGESEVELVEGEDSVEATLPTPPPAPPPPRKRGRPRKSAPTGSAASKPADANDPVKEESGSGRRRAAGRGRAAAASASTAAHPANSSGSAAASASTIRTRGMKEPTKADVGGETPSATNAGAKRGRGAKTRNAPPARTSPTPVPTSISPSAPRIIAPPPEPTANLDDSPQQKVHTPSPLPVEEDAKVSVDQESLREDGSPELGAQAQALPRGLLPVAGEAKDTDAEEEDRHRQEDGDIAGSRDPSESQSVDGTQERGASRAVDPTTGSPGAGIGGATDVAAEGEILAPVVNVVVGAGDGIMDVESEVARSSKESPPISTQSELAVDVEMGDAPSQPTASSASAVRLAPSPPSDPPPALSTSLEDQTFDSTLLGSKHQEHGSVLPEGPGQASPREPTPSATVPDSSATTGPIEISAEILTLNSPCGAPPDNAEGTIGTITEIAAAPATSEERGHSPLNASISVEGVSNGMFNKENADHDSEIDAEHDADMDAEADEDLDAEGEYEDEREGYGGQSTWSHVAFSSSDISKLLQGADEEGEDADAEGEIEDELDEPSSSTVFYP
ncbi:hypothetical protein MD484_g4812, partial [Candolleomyces efflorescens]